MIRCSILEGSRISVNSKETGETGIGEHLNWVQPVLNIALFESTCCAPFCAVFPKAPNQSLHSHAVRHDAH